MKLLRVGPAGAERPALLDAGGTLRDLSELVTDVDGALLADDAALERVRAAAAAGGRPARDAGGRGRGPRGARGAPGGWR
ncbi:2-hydroxyhepta-2,4-diene-1,7-dioate isomerase, partial [Streptomyces sp. NPDC006422]